MVGSSQHSPRPTTNPYSHVQVTITGNYPDPAFMIQHCGDTMPRLATIDGHSDLINSTYPRRSSPPSTLCARRRSMLCQFAHVKPGFRPTQRLGSSERKP